MLQTVTETPAPSHVVNGTAGDTALTGGSAVGVLITVLVLVVVGLALIRLFNR